MNFYTLIVIFLQCMIAFAIDTTTIEENSSESDTPITDTTEVYLKDLFSPFADNEGNIEVSKAKEINEKNCQNDQEILKIIESEQKDEMVDFENLVKAKCTTLRTIEKKLNNYGKEHLKDDFIEKEKVYELINDYARDNILCKQAVDIMVTCSHDENTDSELIRKMKDAVLYPAPNANISTITKQEAIDFLENVICQISYEELKKLILTYKSSTRWYLPSGPFAKPTKPKKPKMSKRKKARRS
ncbi:uncharacterized protein LOC126906538 isoform X2 [Daktulosphaira vitifoliae]|uniref:uncharacterized protein LOC126906538 isoform X2 n=1 Tax=Daktulosphaira vitifoliae TaxID=58002 RepID=UPI0021AA4350|nr:uncharacterized protein LOC126906538 isoform X2 [Daktulosphaira vitifoliae]